MTVAALSTAPAELDCDDRRKEYYVRTFPGQGSRLLDNLSHREFVAKFRIDCELARRGGALPADDKLLATVTKLSPNAWAKVRDKLLALGLVRIEDGLWIDDDQQRSLAIQRNNRLRGQRGAQARWSAQRA